MGVVTLVLACLFAAAWIRSQLVLDLLRFPAKKHVTDSTVTAIFDEVISTEGSLVFQRATGVYSGIAYQTGLRTEQKRFRWLTLRDRLNFENAVWKWRWLGSGFCHQRIEDRENGVDGWEHWLLIPYWSIVMPLTLLSACLLLRKPRPPKKPTQPTEPDHA
jgi:hypothetical protein